MLEQGVKAVVERHVEEGCARACAEVAKTLGVVGLFPKDDPSSGTARCGITAMVRELAEQFTKVMLVAALLPAPVHSDPPSDAPPRRPRLVVVTPSSDRNGP